MPDEPTATPPAPTTPPAPPAPAPSELVLDPENLPPAVVTLLDQERMKASKTARANALKDAAKDPQIQAAVRAQLEEEARMTADERVAAKERELEQKETELAIKQNTVAVESILITNGIEKQTAAELAATLATSDEKLSTKQAEAFVATFKTAVDAQVTAIKNELLANGGAPKQGGTPPTTQESYEKAYKDATDSGDTVTAIAIQRRAAQEGITIQ